MTALAPDASQPLIRSPLTGFIAGLIGYFLLLGFIWLQYLVYGRFLRKQKGFGSLLIQSELLAYLIVYYFVFGANRAFEALPVLASFHAAQAAFALLLYLGGMVVFYQLQHRSDQEASRQFKFMLPLVLPFLSFTLMLDFLYLFQFQKLDETTQIVILLSLVALFVLATVAFFPYILLRFWGCAPMADSPLKDRLEGICRRVGFTHGGIVIWKVMGRTLTAAIIGVIPKWRYILFTQSILEKLSPAALEAVLAHEIGHSQRRHLLYLPLIFLGMSLCAALITDSISPVVENHSGLGKLLLPIAYFLLYAAIFILYFRFVFGYFSRLFERQADLHVISCGIPLEAMIEALNDVGTYTGNTHLLPSWHHYSIRQRTDFLKNVLENPALEHAHHRKVRLSLVLYAVFFLGILGYLLI